MAGAGEKYKRGKRRTLGISAWHSCCKEVSLKTILLPVQLILTKIPKKDLLSLRRRRHQVVKSGLIHLSSIFKIHKENTVFRKASIARRDQEYKITPVRIYTSVRARLPTVEVENEEASG